MVEINPFNIFYGVRKSDKDCEDIKLNLKQLFSVDKIYLKTVL